MSIRFSSGISTGVLVAALGMAPAAWAQSLTTKDAWEALNAFISGAGGTLSTTGLQRDGNAMVARDVTLTAAGQQDGLTISVDEVRLEPRGDQVAIIPSATFGTVWTSSALSERRDYSITHDGELRLTLSEELMGLALDFGSLQIDKTGALRRGAPLDEALMVMMSGLGGAVDVTLAEPIGVTGRLTAAVLDYTLQMTDTQFMTIRQDGRSETRDLVLDFAAAGLSLLDDQPGFLRRAFDSGFSARLSLENGATRSTASQTIDTFRTDFTLNADSSAVSVTAQDGEVSLSSRVAALDLTVTDPLPVTATAERLSFAISLPVVATETDRPFAVSTALTEARVGRALLDMVGAGDFADETVTLETELRADGRWLLEITDNPEPEDQPVDFTSFSLVNLLTRVGASALTGSGSFTLAPGAFAAAGEDFPDGEGRFQFDLRGGEALLNRLGAIGLIPPDQQFLARMMMNGLGRSVGPDHLQSDVVIARGGAITVNGMPLPF